MSSAPVGNETAVFIRNADDNYGIGLYNTGELIALRVYDDGGGDDVIGLRLYGSGDRQIGSFDVDNVIAVIWPQNEVNKAAMKAVFDASVTRTQTLVQFEPVELDTDIGLSYEKMSTDKRYYRRHDRPRIFFDKSITVNWTWNPVTWMFNALFFGDKNGNDAPHGVQPGLSDGDTPTTWRPRTTCFELNDPFNSENRGYHVRVVFGKMYDNWRIADVEDACFSTVSDTPTMDDLADQGVELYGTKFDFTHLNEEYVTTDSEGFPVSAEVWGTNVGTGPS